MLSDQGTSKDAIKWLDVPLGPRTLREGEV